MATVSKSALKARMLEYFRQIEQSGEELVVTSGGRPVLKVVPYAEKAAVDTVFADVRGRLAFTEDPDAPTLGDWGDA